MKALLSRLAWKQILVIYGIEILGTILIFGLKPFLIQDVLSGLRLALGLFLGAFLFSWVILAIGKSSQ